MTATDRQSDVLLGRRVLLRALEMDDFDEWAEVRNRCSEWLTKWEPRAIAGIPQVHNSRLAFGARCTARERDRESGNGYGFGIFMSGRFVGEINLNNIIRGACQNAYVGYWIDEAMAGQGIMPESVVTISQYAFETLGLHRVQVAVIPRNQASVRVAEKLRLRSEGIAERYLEINGVWEDHVRYAMTHEEWIDRREELFDEWIL